MRIFLRIFFRDSLIVDFSMVFINIYFLRIFFSRSLQYSIFNESPHKCDFLRIYLNTFLTSVYKGIIFQNPYKVEFEKNIFKDHLKVNLKIYVFFRDYFLRNLLIVSFFFILCLLGTIQLGFLNNVFLMFH